MRNPDQIKERIQLAIIEEIQNTNLLKEPENYMMQFINNLSEKITEITLDEILFRKRF